MATRVALVACTNAAEGPWTLAKGNETGIKIVHLVEGEHIRLEVVRGDTQLADTFFQPGMFPVEVKQADKYRVLKFVKEGVKPSPTTVEIVLSGTP